MAEARKRALSGPLYPVLLPGAFEGADPACKAGGKTARSSGRDHRISEQKRLDESVCEAL